MKSSHAILLIVLLLCIPYLSTARSENILIATDNNYWYPYSYVEKDQIKGIHIEIVKEALKHLGYESQFTALPWKRCLRETEIGNFNAIVSASYKQDRAQYLFYPEDASTAKESKWRITQVEYIVVSNSDDPYIFNGDLNTLPHPIRAPLGYSIVDDLKSKNINVTTDYTTFDNFNNLVQNKKGVVITPTMNAQMLQNKPSYKDKIKIHEIPISSKSYFMVFSVKSPKVDGKNMQMIWDEIAKVRDDKEFIGSLIEKF